MKKLSHSLVLGIFSLLICASALAEEWKSYKFRGSDSSEDKIRLDQGDKVEFINLMATSFNDIHLRVNIKFDEDISTNLEYFCNSSSPRKWYGSGNLTVLKNFETLYGPCEISIGSQGAGNMFIMCSLKIPRANESQSKNVTGYSLVLPESTDTSYNLVLESSTDLVNWTADKTGTKGPSEKKRFYRLRAVKE